MAYGVYQHPLLRDLDYIWRVTPGLEFYCDIDYDPMAMMALNNKVCVYICVRLFAARQWLAMQA